MTILRVTRGHLTMFAGGMGGPAVQEGVLLNVYTGEEGDYLGLVVRAPSSVSSLLVETDFRSVPIALHRSEVVDGVRIGGGILRRGQSLRAIEALDADGGIVAEQAVRPLRGSTDG